MDALGGPLPSMMEGLSRSSASLPHDKPGETSSQLDDRLTTCAASRGDWSAALAGVAERS